jgi:GntR family transcriptional regulator, transcriptional repressor for pyruvate dehydrogenase complex
VSTARTAQEFVGRQVRAPKTAELIAGHIRGQIVRAELRTGETLPAETALMEQFGVSRPTLREAFRILESESLITVRRGSRGGAQVMAPDVTVAARYVGLLLQVDGTTVADVYEARLVLEPAAAGLLASRRTKQDIGDLHRCIDELSALIEGDEPAHHPQVWADATGKFRALVLERAGNRTLAMLAAMLREVVASHVSAAGRRLSQPESANDFRKTVRAYRKLVSLIEAKDTAEAERYWRTHMEIAGRRLLRDDLGTKTVIDLFS